MVIKPISYNAPVVTPEQLRSFFPASSLKGMPWMPEFSSLSPAVRGGEAWRDLLEKATAEEPIYGIGHGLAKLGAAAFGGYQEGKSEREQDRIKAENRKVLADWLQSGGQEDNVAGFTSLLSSDDPTIQAIGSALLERTPTSAERERLGLAREELGVSREKLRSEEERDRAALQERIAARVAENEQAMQEFNLKSMVSQPEFRGRVAGEEARGAYPYRNIPAAEIEPMALQHPDTGVMVGAVPNTSQMQQYLDEGYVPIYQPFGVGPTGIGDVPTDQTTLGSLGGGTAPDISAGASIMGTVGRGLNVARSTLGMPPYDAVIQSGDAALAQLQNRIRETASFAQRVNPTNYNIQLANLELPQATLTTSPYDMLVKLIEVHQRLSDNEAAVQQTIITGTRAQKANARQALSRITSTRKEVAQHIQSLQKKTGQGLGATGQTFIPGQGVPDREDELVNKYNK